MPFAASSFPSQQSFSMPLASRKRKASLEPRSGADDAGNSNTRRDQRTAKDGARAPSTSPALLSDVWLLRARPFDGDVRSKEATDLKAYLVGGKTYVVGSNAKVADVVVKEDKTVSRTHATLRVVAGCEDDSGGRMDGRLRSKQSKQSKRSDENTVMGGAEGDSAYVEVVDTSSHGRTYLSSDMRGILKAQRMRDNNGEGSARAHHGYFLMLGQMSPFRLTRLQMGVCLSGEASSSVKLAIRSLGMREVEASERMRSVARMTWVVVGDVSTSEQGSSAVIDVRDEVLLGMVLGVPVVTGEWARAWLEEGRAATSAPREADYGVSVISRIGTVIETVGFEREKVVERLSGLLGGYRLGCVAGDVSGALVAAARGLGLAVDVVEGRDGIEDWVLGCSETPLMVLRKQGDVRLLPQPACGFCLLEDLRLALLDGDTGGLVRRVGERAPSKSSKGGYQSADDAIVTKPHEEGDGWHTAFGHSPPGSRGAEDTEIDEDFEAHPIYTTEAPVIVKGRGIKSKKFTKKHRGPEAANRMVIQVIGDRREGCQDEKAWEEIEQERQAMMEAFDKQGLVVGAKKKAPRRRS